MVKDFDSAEKQALLCMHDACWARPFGLEDMLQGGTSCQTDLISPLTGISYAVGSQALLLCSVQAVSSYAGCRLNTQI
eukprot:3459797-Rhodomonas_salina.3